MEQMGFGSKRKGLIGMNATEYQLHELPNNQYLLGGSPEGVVDSRCSGGGAHCNIYTGPIILAFLDQQKKPTYTTIPRHNRAGKGSNSLFIPHKNKVIVLYNDLKKALMHLITLIKSKKRLRVYQRVVTWSRQHWRKQAT